MTTTDHPTTITRLDRWRLAWYLKRVKDQLPNIPDNQWNHLRAELDADITEAAERVGMRQAIADLGPAKELGRSYFAALDL